VTKQGYTFVFDRVTGKPIFPIKETPFPQEVVPGEQASPTQPIPQHPAPFARQSFTEQDINPFAADRDSLVAVVRKANTGSPYIPLTSKMTVFFPGTDGGAQWGGAASDPAGILYIPSKEVPVYTSLIPRRQASASSGKAMFAGNSPVSALLFRLSWGRPQGKSRWVLSVAVAGKQSAWARSGIAGIAERTGE